MIEIMIVVLIVAIISGLALESYSNQTTRARRAEAKAFLLEIAAKEESFFSQYVSYTDVIARPGGACVGVACGLGLGANISPRGFYSVTAALLPAGCAPGGAQNCTAYTLTATPVGIFDADCTTMTYTNINVRGSTGAGTINECWR